MEDNILVLCYCSGNYQFTITLRVGSGINYERNNATTQATYEINEDGITFISGATSVRSQGDYHGDTLFGTASITNIVINDV